MRGGKRIGSGRKQKWSEPLKRIWVPESLIPRIKQMLAEKLASQKDEG